MQETLALVLPHLPTQTVCGVVSKQVAPYYTIYLLYFSSLTHTHTTYQFVAITTYTHTRGTRALISLHVWDGALSFHSAIPQSRLLVARLPPLAGKATRPDTAPYLHLQLSHLDLSLSSFADLSFPVWEAVGQNSPPGEDRVALLCVPGWVE